MKKDIWKLEEILEGLDKNKATVIFDELTSEEWDSYQESDKELLRAIFNHNLDDQRFFTNVSGINKVDCTTKEDALKLYIHKWGCKYLDTKLPSLHSGKKSPSPYDQAIYMIIQCVSHIDEKETEKIRASHEKAMQSENLIGALLEEYISSQLSSFGWIWCKGSTVQATDFIFVGESTVRIQIKNKYNTENSSSDKIREGTDIQKWFRLTSKKQPGSDESVSNWPALKEILSKNGCPDLTDVDLSEEGFRSFIKKVCEENPNIIEL